jgi:23S rRNA G2445 N2-methylase RlmL
MTSQVSRMFATCLPGLAPLVGQQLRQRPRLLVTGSGFDGRADLVLFDAGRGDRDGALALRTVDDVFIEVGRADRADTGNPRRIAGLLWRQELVQRALSVWAEHNRPLARTMTFRVVARVLSEKTFRRTDLRYHVTEQVRLDRQRWHTADPAQLEIWACEYQPGRFVAGLRLTDSRKRQHGGRSIERPGALRPALAAAMVQLAGHPSGTLLDPCCGSGTILTEALAAGWLAAGSDIDAAAAGTARANAPSALIDIDDILHLRRPDASVAACVTNLPFGRQYRVAGEMSDWLRAALREVARVVAPGSMTILLAPDIPRASVPASLSLTTRFPVRLLGLQTTIWGYHRTAVPSRVN